MNDWIEVIGGNRWEFGSGNNILNLTVPQLAKALSQINRFNGHTDAKYPYSVAQHSVVVSEILDHKTHLAFAGLMHDAPEIIICDFPRPLKNYLGDNLLLLEVEEDTAFNAIAKAIKLPYWELTDTDEKELKAADIQAMVTEKRDMLNSNITWGYWDDVLRLEKKISPVTAKKAAAMFCKRYKELEKRLARAS